MFWCSGYNLCLFSAALWLLHRLLRGLVRPAVGRRFLLLLVFASPFTFHVQEYYSEVFTTVLVGVGTLAVLTRRTFWGWVAIVLGVVNTPASVVGLLLASLYALAATRRWRWVLLVPVSAALILLESYLRRGNPFVSGYENNRGFPTILPYSGLPGFSYPLFFGVLSILFSFGKGLLFFTPGLFLTLPRDEQRRKGADGNVGLPPLATVHVCWLLFTAGLVLVYARWWAWYGGWAWGPRFFLFAALPASLALAANLGAGERQSLGRNLLVLSALALSFWAGANGRVFRDADLELCTADDFALEHLAWYVPEFSILWRPFVNPEPLNVGDGLVLGVYALGFLYLAVPQPLLRRVNWPAPRGHGGTLTQPAAPGDSDPGRTPPPRPLPEAERGSRKEGLLSFRLPLSASGRGRGGGVRVRASPPRAASRTSIRVVLARWRA